MYLIQHHTQCEIYKEIAVQLRSFDVSSLLVNGTGCLVKVQASVSNFTAFWEGGSVSIAETHRTHNLYHLYDQTIEK
jgi:hypothetical protein